MAIKKKNKQFSITTLQKFLEKYVIFVFIFTFGFLYSFIAIVKYLHFQTGLDLAIYVQSMWFYTHLQLPYVTLYPTYGDLVWADHFSPSFMLLTPFYLLWKDPRILLIIQSFALVSGAYPIYRFAKEELKSNFLGLSFAVSFLLFFGVQNPLTFDFHMATMAGSFGAWIIWAMFKEKWKTFVILCVIASGFKEDMSLYVATFALYLIFSRKNWKLGLVMFPLFLGYAYLVTKKIMPSLAHDAAKIFNLSYFSFDLKYLFSTFFDNPEKMRTVLLSFGYLFFLPLLSGFFLLLPLAHFFINFSNPSYAGRWGIELHYRVYLAAMLFFGAILAISFLTKKFSWLFTQSKTKVVLGIMILFNAFLFDLKLHLPLNVLTKNQFYFQESWIADNNNVIKQIPPDAYLLTTNNLSPQVAYRKNVFYYPQNIDKADYIFIDLHPGQPDINFWLTEPSYDIFIKKIEIFRATKKEFTVIYKSNDAILLGRKDKK